jgi:hypothetical protein
MVKVEQIDNSTCLVASENPKKEGLVIHGYGGNKEEMLGLAINLAESADLKLLVFDLPGHGSLSNEEFNLKNSLKRLDDAAKMLKTSNSITGPNSPLFIKTEESVLRKADFYIGHSVGARLGLIAGMGNGALLSMPGSAFFEGRKKDLVRTLRVRRVKEKIPFNGLEEILSVEIKPGDGDLLILADQDIQSVKSFYDEWQNKGYEYQKIKGSNHLDIISSGSVIEEIKKWLEN